MTLTVVDGDFPREVLADQNLTFADYRMPLRRNNARSYDANMKSPGTEKEGILKLGEFRRRPSEAGSPAPTQIGRWLPFIFSLGAIGVLMLAMRRAR